VNGQSQSAQAGQSITFTGLSGTVSWSVQSPITVPIGRYRYTRYYANPSSGTASSGGTISITYSTSSTLSVSISANPMSGNAPLTVHFHSSVSGGTGRYSYYWMFGDGSSSTVANPTHTYYSGGTYYVKLFVSSGSQTAYSNIIAIKVVVSTYSYTFYEIGLPAGTVWTVTMNGHAKSASAGQSITFTGLSGTNSWSASRVPVSENHKHTYTT